MKPRTISSLASSLLLAIAFALGVSMECTYGAPPDAETGGQTGKPASPADVKSAEPSDSEVLPAHCQVTVYEVQAEAARFGELDGKALAAKATTAESLLSALSSVGTARILYRIDQQVNVCSERIMLGGSEPVVTGARTTSTGQTVKSITYQNVGLIVHLKAKAVAKDPTVTMNVELSALAPSDAEIAPGVKATATRTMSLEHSEPLQFGHPLVMLSVSSTSSDPKVPPAAYVIRYLFTAPTGK